MEAPHPTSLQWRPATRRGCLALTAILAFVFLRKIGWGFTDSIISLCLAYGAFVLIPFLIRKFASSWADRHLPVKESVSLRSREIALAAAIGAFAVVLMASSKLQKVEEALRTINNTIAQMEQHRDSANLEAIFSNFVGAVAHGMDGNYGWGVDREYERREADQSRQSMIQQAYAYREQAQQLYDRNASTRNWSVLALILAGGFSGFLYWKERQGIQLTPPPLPTDPPASL